MRVISKKRLKEFAAVHPQAHRPLMTWYKTASQATWSTFHDVKASHPTASSVVWCVVFNIGGNNYRLVTRLNYRRKIVYVLKVMTHKEYDDQTSWQTECGCLKPPPKP